MPEAIYPADQGSNGGGAKKPWLSKTIITNLLLAILAFLPGTSEWYAAHPDIVASGWAVINVILRFITKDSIQIRD